MLPVCFLHGHIINHKKIVGRKARERKLKEVEGSERSLFSLEWMLWNFACRVTVDLLVGTSLTACAATLTASRHIRKAREEDINNVAAVLLTLKTANPNLLTEHQNHMNRFSSLGQDYLGLGFRLPPKNLCPHAVSNKLCCSWKTHLRPLNQFVLDLSRFAASVLGARQPAEPKLTPPGLRNWGIFVLMKPI